MCEDNPVKEIVSLFGGLKRMAAIMGHKNHSTIYGWVRAQRIPAWRDAELKKAAGDNGIQIPASTYSSAFSKARNNTAVAA
ncbi:carph-isopro domain-containing protein [Acetobacter sp. KSO5]|uniref:carph-isopro domain-containing protein n=1 Tax=Acetobacter sp. KSO5 TaxID=3373674 RepID=UPI00376F1820